jgi:hypothetical protein
MRYCRHVFIRELLAALATRRVPYCVVGGVAVNLHGVPRMTYDVDLVVPTTIEALTAIDRLLTELGLRCRLPIKLADLADESLRVSYRDERNLIAVTYTDPADPLREVDILVSPPIAANDLVARAIRLTLGDISVPVIAIEDLIAISEQADARKISPTSSIWNASPEGNSMANGFTYWVSDEQLRTFASLSPERRLRWLEEMRELTFELAPAKTKAAWAILRR